VSVLKSLSGYLSPIVQLGPSVGWLSQLIDHASPFTHQKRKLVKQLGMQKSETS
jgi:hypothetical protein